MGEWAILHADEPPAAGVWSSLGTDGIRVVTQVRRFNLICRDELGWDLRCLVRESPPTLVPLVIRRRRGRLPVLAESLAHGQIGGALAERPIEGDDAAAVEHALRRAALEVVIYPGNEGFCPVGWERLEFTTHAVHLAAGPKARWSATRACQSAARHAERCGIDVVRIRGEPFLHRASLLHARQQHARGLRACSTRWLSRLLDELDDSVGLWGAVQDGRLLAVLLVGWYRDAATALLSASDPQARPLKAGNLLYLRVLEWLMNAGIRTVDLGGSRNLPALEAFKRSLGGVPVSRPYYRYRHPGLTLYQHIASSPWLTVARRAP